MSAVTAFVLSRQPPILAAAIVLGILGTALRVLGTKLAERQATERVAAYVASLTPDEVAEILARPQGRQP